MSHPGWQDLVEIFRERRSKFESDLGQQLTSSPQPVDQRKIDFERGRWAGVKDVLDEPARAIRALRKEQEVLR